MSSKSQEPASESSGRDVSHNTPIFVLGAFHSATTILYRLLAMHPDTTWFSQFSLRNGRIPGRRRLPLYGQIDRISRRLFTHDWVKRPNTRREMFVARPTEGQLIWEYIIPRTDSLDPAASTERLRDILEGELQRWRKSCFLAKYPYLTRHISILSDAYPNARLVHIVRDGRAVALSLKRSRLEEKERDHVVLDGKVIAKSDLPASETRGHIPISSEEDARIRTGRYWLRCLNEVQRAKDKMHVTEIRYEDLCEDVKGSIESLLNEIGLDVSRFPFDQCPTTLVSTNENKFQAASPEELESLERELGDALRLYSYI